jgi:hypothetical protein
MPSPAGLAAATPAGRDRFVDLIRVASIGIVVAGHWLMAVPAWPPGRSLNAGNALASMPGLAVLTWVLQVMPLFFVVGGYANARSLESVARRGGRWPEYLAARVRRLVQPTALFTGAWVVLAGLAHLAGPAGRVFVPAAAVIAQPIWFLGIYLVVVAAAPGMLALHRRFGLAVPIALGIGALIVDDLRLPAGDLHGLPVGLGIGDLGVLSFPLVWLLAHQLGFFWADGRLTRLSRPVLAGLAATGLGLIIFLTSSNAYPASMVGLPGERFSNMNPPSVCIVALTLWLTGLAMLVRPALTRWLERPRVWAGVVGGGSVVMTVYLWHLTALVATVAVLYPLGWPTPTPGSGIWWALRPVWLAACGTVLIVLVKLLGRAERPRPSERTGGAGRGAGHGALVLGGCLALAIGLLGLSGTGVDVFGPERTLDIAGLHLHQLSSLAVCAAGAGASLLATRTARR